MEQSFDTVVDGQSPSEPPSPSPSITRRRTPAALAVGVHPFKAPRVLASSISPANSTYRGGVDGDYEPQSAFVISRKAFKRSAVPTTIRAHASSHADAYSCFVQCYTITSTIVAVAVKPHFFRAVLIVAAKCGSRIFLSSICQIAISMAYSPTPHCFTYPARSYRVCC